MSEPKCCPSSVVTLTFDLLTPKYIGIFLSPSMYEIWKLCFENDSSYHVRKKSVDKVQFWPWPLGPKMYRYFPLTIMHLCMKYESSTLKILKLSCQNQSVDRQIDRRTDRHTNKPDSYRAPSLWLVFVSCLMFMNADLILCMFMHHDQISSTATFLCDLDFSCSRSLNNFGWSLHLKFVLGHIND